MTDTDSQPPDDLAPALAMVRDLWREGSDRDLSEPVIAMAMMIEAVDRLTRLHGPLAMSGMLDRLRDAVRDTPLTGGGTLQ